MDVTGSDPLPYGIGPNRKVLEELLGHALKQGIITRPMTVEELFVPSTHKLVG
jgi:4,5-dihydroxyphthalate decarboxylase